MKKRKRYMRRRRRWTIYRFRRLMFEVLSSFNEYAVELGIHDSETCGLDIFISSMAELQLAVRGMGADTTDGYVTHYTKDLRNGLVEMRCMVAYFMDDNDVITGIHHRIIASFDGLRDKCEKYQQSYSGALRYYRAVVRHELGHVLDDRQSVIGRTMDEHNKIRDREDEEFEAEYELIDHDVPVADFLKAYHQITKEKRADELVGLTYKDFVA